MKRLRILVVDDEPLARKRICSLLASHQDVEVLGECSNGLKAIEAIQAQEPDLVFLDIQMPELDGFGVVDAVTTGHRPAFIFVTAYDEHAVRAFEVNALDYLLKPFDAERFADALRRAREKMTMTKSDRSDFEQQMLKALARLGNGDYTNRLVIKVEDRVVLLDVDDVAWIEAAGKYVRLHSGDSQYLLRESMSHLESRLDPQKFARIHRSTIVNLDSVESFEPAFHGEYRVCMKGGQPLTMSRGYRAKLRERFGNSI